MKKKLLIAIAVVLLIANAFTLLVLANERCPFGLHPVIKRPTCTDAISCWACKSYIGGGKGHIWAEKTCYSPKTCKKCGEKEGEFDHVWIRASCTNPETCAECGKTRAKAMGHNYFNGVCKRCRAVTYGIWEKNYFVDSFGDKTDSVYITSSFSGTFSNSATTNSKMDGYWIVDGADISIVIFEYGSNRMKGSIKTVEYNVRIKDMDGNVHKTTLTLKKDDDRLRFSSGKSMYNILSKGGKLSFYIENKDRAIEKYNFTIDDATGFKNLFDEIWTWK